MGQAFRRAAGKVRAPATADSSSSLKPKTSIDTRPGRRAPDEVKISTPADLGGLQSDDQPTINVDNVLEDRDPKFDAMLNKMVGRIQTKPGGKLEMGEASVAERYSRPMPKLRNTNPDSSRYEERPVPAGTLNVAQLRHILLLHQGKADDHSGPMGVPQIAEKFRMDPVQVQKIVQFISLPPEDESKQKPNQ